MPARFSAVLAITKTDPDVAKPTCGASFAKEHSPALGPGTAISQIIGDGGADVRRQGHLRPLPAFAVDQQLTGSPVEVVQHQRGHFFGSQAKTGQKCCAANRMRRRIASPENVPQTSSVASPPVFPLPH